jgi:hypothetical protein
MERLSIFGIPDIVRSLRSLLQLVKEFVEGRFEIDEQFWAGRGLLLSPPFQKRGRE